MKSQTRNISLVLILLSLVPVGVPESLFCYERQTVEDTSTRAKIPSELKAKEFTQNRKVSRRLLEEDATGNISSISLNGVRFEVRVRTVQTADSSNIEIDWTLKYTGPRHPLTIVKPTLTESTSQTHIDFFAFAHGKEDGFRQHVGSPYKVFQSGKLMQYGPYEGQEKVLASTTPGGTFTDIPMVVERDWFITVPKGKMAQGTMVVSGRKLKHFYLKSFPGEYDADRPPRLFFRLSHLAVNRGIEFSLDAWDGELRIPALLVPQMKQW